MTVLDTNVVSALMHGEVDSAVVAWLDRQRRESIWTTAVTVYEIRFGIELLASGRRRLQLEDAFQHVIEEDLQNRILSFDYDAATEAAIRSAQSRAVGRPLDIRDLEIAGIVAARRAALATRNTRHFQNLSLELVDPWTSR